MRILVDLRLLGRGDTGGIQEYARNLMQALLTHNGHHEYTAFYNGFRTQPLPVVHPNIKIANWHIPNKVLDASTRLLRWPKINRHIATDLVFSPHFNILETERVPHLITFHDFSFIHHPDFFSWRQRFWHWLQDYRRQAERASHIIAVSQFTKSDLINLLGIPEEKISVIYSGIDPIFTLPQREERARRQRTHGRPYFLSLGTIEPRKNVTAIIHAFNRVKQDESFRYHKLVIAGRHGWLYHDVLRAAKESPVAADIIFTGSVHNSERVVLYTEAEALVYPSFFEGFGFPPLEAQACGTPVIVADRTSLPEIVGDAAIKIHPWRTADLADAMVAVVTNTTLRTSLIERGRLNAKKFNWHTTAEHTLHAYQRATQQ